MIVLPSPVIIDNQEDAEWLLARILDKRAISFDTETTGTDRWRDTVVCWSLAWEDDEYGDRKYGVARAVLESRFLHPFAPLFSSNITKFMHNAPFDMCMAWNSGVAEINGKIVCTQALDCCIDENRYGAHDLKTCAWDYLGLKMGRFEETVRAVMAELSKTLPPDEYARINKIRGYGKTRWFPIRGLFGDYASADAWATFVLAKHALIPLAQKDFLGERNGKTYTVWDNYKELFCDINRVVANMCRRGWLIDTNYFQDMIPAAEASLCRIDVTFNRYAALNALIAGKPLHEEMVQKGSKHIVSDNMFPGGAINPGSDAQLRHFLFNIMGYPVIQMTDGGTSGKKQPSVSDEVLEILYKEHGCNFASLVQERRDIQKTLSTYLRGLVEAADPNGRVHASLRVMGARTGRFSCTEPNLQNIRRPSEDPYCLRGGFIASPGHTLIAADYSNLEMRIAANLSGCPTLSRTIMSGKDIHALTAELMFKQYTHDEIMHAKKNVHNMDYPPEDRARMSRMLIQRDAAKTIGFGILYSRGAASIASVLNLQNVYGISKEEARDMAQSYIDSYLDTYSGIREHIKKLTADCKRLEYVQTWLGRKRRLDAVNSSDKYSQREALRQMFNATIQGTGADIVMLAMVACEFDEFLRSRNCLMLMQVHDELVFDCPDEYADECEPRIVELMESPTKGSFAVPITVSSGRGKSWDKAK